MAKATHSGSGARRSDFRQRAEKVALRPDCRRRPICRSSGTDLLLCKNQLMAKLVVEVQLVNRAPSLPPVWDPDLCHPLTVWAHRNRGSADRSDQSRYRLKVRNRFRPQVERRRGFADSVRGLTRAPKSSCRCVSRVMCSRHSPLTDSSDTASWKLFVLTLRVTHLNFFSNKGNKNGDCKTKCAQSDEGVESIWWVTVGLTKDA